MQAAGIRIAIGESSYTVCHFFTSGNIHPELYKSIDRNPMMILYRYFWYFIFLPTDGADLFVLCAATAGLGRLTVRQRRLWGAGHRHADGTENKKKI